MSSPTFQPLPHGDPVEPLPPELHPSVDHLVTEDDTPVDNIYSERQQRLLTEPLYSSWPGPGEGRPFLALANVGLFYSPELPPLVPDAMLAVDVRGPGELRLKRHRSYFIWQFGKPPDVGIEVVSNVEGGELGRKMRTYAEFGVPYYVVWDPFQFLSEIPLQVFITSGRKYVPLNKPWFPEVGLGLRVWHGAYEGFEDDWLRWCDAQGGVIPTGQELAREARQQAEQARQQAEQARQQAEQARQQAKQAEERAARLAEQLRKLGQEPQ